MVTQSSMYDILRKNIIFIGINKQVYNLKTNNIFIQLRFSAQHLTETVNIYKQIKFENFKFTGHNLEIKEQNNLFWIS